MVRVDWGCGGVGLWPKPVLGGDWPSGERWGRGVGGVRVRVRVRVRV